MSATFWRTWCGSGRLRKKTDKAALKSWWGRSTSGGRVDSLAYRANKDVIMPQYAIQRLYELTKDRDTYITTEVGQHQMWAAQFYGFEEPNRWMTSGGLGTMGYGLPAALRRAGRASRCAGHRHCRRCLDADVHPGNVRRRCSTNLPVKIFILNNQYMGMVRQWQQLLHGNRLSHSYTDPCRIS
jgi:acetolactate synthase-1/2/3 large subunit